MFRAPHWTIRLPSSAIHPKEARRGPIRRNDGPGNPPPPALIPGSRDESGIAEDEGWAGNAKCGG